MRAPDSEYNSRKWQAHGVRQATRRRWLRWALLASIGFALLTAGSQTVFVPNRPPNLTAFWIPAIIMGFSPFGLQSWITRRRLATFDEFEQVALRRATTLAYGCFLGLVLVLIAWVGTATAMHWSRPQTAYSWLGWGIALSAIGVVLPATFAEWIVPMPDPEDQPL